MTTHLVNFLDMGDLAAPKGSPPWCLAVREEARHALQSAKSTREQVQSWVTALREDDRFRQLTDMRGDRFLTWDAFCLEPPPYGFGMTALEVEELIASKPLAQQMAAPVEDGGVPRAMTRAEAGSEGGRGNKKASDNITSFSSDDRGTSASYLVRRLKRDAPEIAEALARGEYPSARAAGIAAGIVKVPTALENAKKAAAKLSKRERQQFRAWLDEQEQP